MLLHFLNANNVITSIHLEPVEALMVLDNNLLTKQTIQLVGDLRVTAAKLPNISNNAMLAFAISTITNTTHIELTLVALNKQAFVTELSNRTNSLTIALADQNTSSCNNGYDNDEKDNDIDQQLSDIETSFVITIHFVCFVDFVS